MRKRRKITITNKMLIHRLVIAVSIIIVIAIIGLLSYNHLAKRYNVELGMYTHEALTDLLNGKWDWYYLKVNDYSYDVYFKFDKQRNVILGTYAKYDDNTSKMTDESWGTYEVDYSKSLIIVKLDTGTETKYNLIRYNGDIYLRQADRLTFKEVISPENSLVFKKSSDISLN